jgi:hypothetical protein
MLWRLGSSTLFITEKRLSTVTRQLCLGLVVDHCVALSAQARPAECPAADSRQVTASAAVFTLGIGAAADHIARIRGMARIGCLGIAAGQQDRASTPFGCIRAKYMVSVGGIKRSRNLFFVSGHCKAERELVLGSVMYESDWGFLVGKHPVLAILGQYGSTPQYAILNPMGRPLPNTLFKLD